MSIQPPEFLSLPELEEIARHSMPTMAYEFLASGAADETTIRWNREALERIRLRPRVLVEVSDVDTSVTLFGRKHAFPILLAPTAYHRALHPDGELETARGASLANATWIVSTATTTSLDDINRVATAPLWLQLYAQSDAAATKTLVDIADGASCEAICLTVDTPTQGVRNRQSRARFALPDGVPTPYMGELLAGRPITDTRRGVVLTWKDIESIRSMVHVPFLLKGIMDADDAELALDSGVDGIIVSNHGGRNLDSVPATIEVLPAIADRVRGRVPLLMDGGIRRGTDIVKAIALGADAVLIGRPYCFGLSVSGATGVQRVVEILRNELEVAMQLMGKRSLSDIDRTAIWSPE